jgi:hypothetical protein
VILRSFAESMRALGLKNRCSIRLRGAHPLELATGQTSKPGGVEQSGNSRPLSPEDLQDLSRRYGRQLCGLNNPERCLAGRSPARLIALQADLRIRHDAFQGARFQWTRISNSQSRRSRFLEIGVPKIRCVWPRSLPLKPCSITS